MPISEPWDIVRVPFPYADRPVRQRRRALVVADGDLQTSHGLLWLAMITSAGHRGGPGDVVISDLGGAGLPRHRINRLYSATPAERIFVKRRSIRSAM
jgi:mRNA interferase MazF